MRSDIKILPSLLGYACLFGSVIAAPAVAAPAVIAAPTVTIASGVVIGKVTTVVSAPAATATVLNYLSVPFAAPPTGTLRFASPVAPSRWTKPLMATSLPPACLQEFGKPPVADNLKTLYNNPGNPPPAESENCLYLNIYAPTDASPASRKPVLFWIFGGNLQFGAGGLTFTNGSSFAAFQDVVVVTVNYRTHIFGFSGSQELQAGKRNAGYLDQRLALQWVQDNIAAFGGDPTKVTIFGQSAGAYSVKQLLANPPDPLPFSAAILESQGLGNGQPGEAYQNVADHFNCSTPGRSTIDCLRQKDAVQLTKYINEQGLTFNVEQDNVTQVNDIRPAIASKRFADVPIYIGSNSQEAKAYLATGIVNTTGTLSEILYPILGGNQTLVDIVTTFYQNSTGRGVNAILEEVLTDLINTCLTRRIALTLADNKYDVWRYYYNASFPNLAFLPGTNGAYHASEIPMVFGAYPIKNYLGPATSNQIGLSGYMQNLWANFAKNPASGIPWNKYVGSFSFNQVGELGGRNATGETTISSTDTDIRCPIYDPLYLLNGF